MLLELRKPQRSDTLSQYSPTSDFGAYLQISREQQFVLDLSQSTLIEVLDELIRMKQTVSPKYGKSLQFLIRHLKLIEDKFGVKSHSLHRQNLQLSNR